MGTDDPRSALEQEDEQLRRTLDTLVTTIHDVPDLALQQRIVEQVLRLRRQLREAGHHV